MSLLANLKNKKYCMTKEIKNIIYDMGILYI